MQRKQNRRIAIYVPRQRAAALSFSCHRNPSTRRLYQALGSAQSPMPAVTQRCSTRKVSWWRGKRVVTSLHPRGANPALKRCCVDLPKLQAQRNRLVAAQTSQEVLQFKCQPRRPTSLSTCQLPQDGIVCQRPLAALGKKSLVPNHSLLAITANFGLSGQLAEIRVCSPKFSRIDRLGALLGTMDMSLPHEWYCAYFVSYRAGYPCKCRVTTTDVP